LQEERTDDWNTEEPMHYEAGSETEDEGDSELVAEKPVQVSRTVKDYTRTKTPMRSKKNETTPAPTKMPAKQESGSDSEDEVPLKASAGSRTRNTSTSSTTSGVKKVTPVTTKKEAPKRGRRGTPAADKESSPGKINYAICCNVC